MMNRGGAPPPYKAPAHTVPPPSGGGSGGVIYPIKSLNPYQNRWTIKARVISKSEIRKWSNPKSSGKLFSVDLVDAEGGEIRATLFNNACDKFYNVLEVDKVYQITKGQIKPANKSFSSVKNDYELTLDENSIIEVCNDQSGAIPRVHYSFVPLANIAECASNTIIDVIGIVSETAEVQSIKSKAGSDLIKRNITLLDMTARTIELTLWGNTAQNISWSPAEHPVLALRGVKVSDFSGKSLSTLSSTIMQVNPDLTEKHQLTAWYEHQGGHVEAYPLTQRSSYGGGDSGARSERPEDRKTFAQVKEENLGSRTTDYFVNKATITMIKHDGPVNLWYTACPTPDCNKKVVEVNMGEWRCDKCGQTFNTCNYRYLLSFSAADYTGSQWLSCFNEIADKILGKDAATMAKMKEENVTNQKKKKKKGNNSRFFV
jgi:replication factor A1